MPVSGMLVIRISESGILYTSAFWRQTWIRLHMSLAICSQST